MMINPFQKDLWDAADAADDRARFLPRFVDFESAIELGDTHVEFKSSVVIARLKYVSSALVVDSVCLYFS